RAVHPENPERGEFVQPRLRNPSLARISQIACSSHRFYPCKIRPHKRGESDARPWSLAYQLHSFREDRSLPSKTPHRASRPFPMVEFRVRCLRFPSLVESYNWQTCWRDRRIWLPILIVWLREQGVHHYPALCSRIVGGNLRITEVQLA